MNTNITIDFDPSTTGEGLCLEYTEILRLTRKVADLGFIPFRLSRMLDGWHLVIKKDDGGTLVSVIEHFGSYGHESDLVETMGCIADGEDVTGYLTAEAALLNIVETVNEYRR